MAIDFSVYNPPGVYTNPIPGPQIAVTSSLPTGVALFGTTVGYESYIQTVIINADLQSATPSVSVAASATGTPGINDVQTVTITGATGGTFTLTFGGQTTGAIAYNAAASAVQTAFQALSSVGNGNATVAGSAGGPYTVTFIGSMAGAAQAVITASATSLTGGGTPTIAVAHTTTGVPPVNAVQVVTVTGTAGTFTLSYSGSTTIALPYNATSSAVQTALQNLPSIGTNSVAVTGSAGGPYTLTFQNTLGGTAITLLTAVASATLTPTLTQTLAQAGINTTTLTVTNPNTGVPYVLNTDYTIQLVSGTINTSNALYAIQRVLSGSLVAGAYIQVQYQYTDDNYFTPTIFYTYQDVVAAYGAPYNLSTGAIQSELTLGAQFAFRNGAPLLVCAAVQPTSTTTVNTTVNGVVTTTTVPLATVGDYTNALDNLQDEPLVAFVVPCNGQAALFEFVKEHVETQSDNSYERRGIVGMDGTATAVPSSQRITQAQSITSSRVMLCSPATFTYFSAELNQSVTLGGQFMAASLAGMCISQSFAMPLTRKVVTGWDNVTEKQLDGQKNLESQNGLCVIELTRQQLIWVRHGLSTDPTDLETREWSVTGQQDAMAYRLRDYLNAASLIGQPIFPYTLVNVKASVEAALQSLLRDGLIVDYTGLSVRQLLTNPDVIEVTYQWMPAFPLNYIVVTFSISLITGASSTSTAGTTSSTNTSNTSSTSSSSSISVPTSSSTNDFGGASNTLMSD